MGAFLINDLFREALQIFQTCLPVSNNISEELVSPLNSPTIFDNNLKFRPVSFLQLFLIF